MLSILNFRIKLQNEVYLGPVTKILESEILYIKCVYIIKN